LIPAFLAIDSRKDYEKYLILNKAANHFYQLVIEKQKSKEGLLLSTIIEIIKAQDLTSSAG
jgi:hypothetical protein